MWWQILQFSFPTRQEFPASHFTKSLILSVDLFGTCRALLFVHEITEDLVK